MDTKQIEYIIKIAEENNITHAAEKLHVTQPALNQQLLNLERELGIQLFHRVKNNWHLTEAGEVYVSNAKKMLNIKKETYKILADMANTKKGKLSIGFTPGRGSTMFSAVYPLFHNKYPDILVQPYELSVKKQQTLISENKLDIGFQTLCDKNKTSDEYIHISYEEILLAAPKSKCLNKPGLNTICNNAADCPEVDINIFKDENFVLMYKESTIRQMVDSIFIKAGFKPKVLFETANNTTILTMIQNNICCGLIPAYYLKSISDAVSCYSLPDHPSWEITASYKKGAYLPVHARYFIQLASDYWS